MRKRKWYALCILIFAFATFAACANEEGKTSEDDMSQAGIIDIYVPQDDIEQELPLKSTLISMGDLDGNGIDDYLVINGDMKKWQSLDDCRHMSVYLNGEKIYEYDNEIAIVAVDPDFGYWDLNYDGKEEIFISFEPLVNSMPLEKYLVLSNTGEEWIALNLELEKENQDKENQDKKNQDKEDIGNSFPISVKRMGEKPLFEIAVEGYKDTIIYDAAKHYTKWIDFCGEEGVYADTYIAYLTGDLSIKDYARNDGAASDWGIWEIEPAYYQGQLCLKAQQGIEGPDGKFDSFGNLYIYFNFSNENELNILGLDFVSDIENDQEENSALLYSKYYNEIYNIEGNKIVSTIDYNDICGKSTFLDVNGEDILVYGDRSADAFKTECYGVWRVNTENGENILVLEDDVYDFKVDVYDGYLIINTKGREHYYSLEDYKEAEEMSYLYKRVEGYTPINYIYSDTYGYYTSIERTIEKIGFVLLEDEEDYIYRYDGVSLKQICGPDKVGKILGYCDNTIFYYYGEKNRKILHVYNYQEDTDTVLSDNIYPFLQVANGKAYYIEYVDESYNMPQFSLKSYETQTASATDILLFKANAGMDDYLPVFGDFTTVGSKNYFVYDNGVDRVNWYVEENGIISELDQDKVIKKYDYSQYGKVIRGGKSTRCEKCGRVISGIYEEGFEFNPEKVECAEVLNSVYAVSEDHINSWTEEYGLKEEGCDEHEVYRYCYEIADVFTIGEDYLVVATEFHYYFDGMAHGLYDNRNRLYNIHTGEEIDFYDITSKTDDELLAYASKVTADDAQKWLKKGYMRYDMRKEEFSREISNLISSKEDIFTWGRDSMIIRYPLYTVVSYATGIIEIEVPYSELGINLE